MMSRAILFLVVLAVFLSLGPKPAGARGDLTLDHDVCALKVGPELIYFAGYQPAASHSRFCEDAPAIGATIFVFDYAEPELRTMKAGFRILRRTEETEESAIDESATVAHLPPQVYPTGTFSFEHLFTEPGDYVGVLTVDGETEHWSARFPFSVGKNRLDVAPYLLIGAAGILALALFVTGRRRPPSTRRRNVAARS